MKHRFRTWLVAAAATLTAVTAQAQIPNFRTLSGSGSRLDTVGILAQLNNPMGAALSTDSQYVYWVDNGRHVLRRVHVGTRRTETVAGIGHNNNNSVQTGPSLSSALNNPQAVAVVGDSIAYVTNYGIQGGNFGEAALAMVNLKAGSTRKLSLGALEYREMTSLAVLPGTVTDTVYYGAIYGSTGGVQMAIISKPSGVMVTGTNLIPSFVASTAPNGITRVGGIVVLGDSLYAGDNRGNIFKFGKTGGFRLFRTGLGNISSLAVLNDTTLLAINPSTGSLNAIDARTGLGTFITSSLVNPTSLVVTDSVVFVTEGSAQRMRYLTRPNLTNASAFVGRNLVPVNGDSLISSYGQTFDVAIGENNTLYVADRSNNLIRRVNKLTGASSTLRTVSGIHDIVYKDSVLYYTENSRNSVFRISSLNLRTGRVQFLAGAAGLSGPAGTQVDGDSATSRLKYPQGLVIDKSGRNLYFGSSGGQNEGGHAIRRVNIATKSTVTVAGSVTPAFGLVDGVGNNARMQDPLDMAIYGDTVIYFLDNGNDRIRKLDLRSFTVTTVAGRGTDVRTPLDNVVGNQAQLANLRNAVADTINNAMLFTDGNRLRRIQLSGTFPVRTVAGDDNSGSINGLGTLARFFTPRGMALDSGNTALYMADAENYTIRKANFIVNTAPTFANAGNVTALENSDLNTRTGWANSILGGSNPEEAQQQVRFFVTGNDNAALFSSQPRVDSLGTLFFRPAVNRFGVATISLIGRDNGGVDGGGVDSSSRVTFTITIDSVNSAPVYTTTVANRTITTNTGVAQVNINNWATAIAASGAPNFEQWQTMQFRFRTKRPELYTTLPSVAISGTNGALSFVPSRVNAGRDTLTVIIQDNGGTTNGGVDTTLGSLIVIVNPYTNVRPAFTVSAANSSLTYPTLINGPATTVNNWATAINAGPTAEAWQTLEFRIVSKVPSMYTSLPVAAITGSGATRTAGLTFTLSGEPGVDTLRVILKDNGGIAFNGVDTLERQLIIRVNPNAAPTFNVTAANLNLRYPASSTQAVNLTNWATTVTPGPAVENPQTLAFTVTSKNAALYTVAPAVNIVGTTTRTGTLAFTLSGVNGRDTLSVSLKDNGGILGGGVDTLVRVVFLEVGPVSLQDQLPAAALRAYPIPVADLLNLDLSGMPTQELVTGVLRNAAGQTVWSASLAPEAHQQLSMSEMPAGMYYLVLTQGGRSITQKVVKR